jgi:hypothetical protein
VPGLKVKTVFGQVSAMIGVVIIFFMLFQIKSLYYPHFAFIEMLAPQPRINLANSDGSY